MENQLKQEYADEGKPIPKPENWWVIHIFYRISIQMFLNHSPKEILNGIFWGLIFGPIQSSLSLEIWSIPPRYILTNQDSVHLACSQNYAIGFSSIVSTECSS